MKRLDTNRNSKTLRNLMMLAAVAVMTVALAAPAEARHKRKHHKHHVKHHRHAVHHVHHPAACSMRGCVVHSVRRGFVVPGKIHRRHGADYRPYYGGRFFDARLGAYVEVYHFPVRTRHGWVYRPHHYFDGRLIAGTHVAYDGPRMSFRINF